MKAPNGGKSTGRHSHCYAEVHIPSDVSKGLRPEKECQQRQKSHNKVEVNGNNGSVPHKTFTINLKPGQYRVNLHLRSHSKPFHITLNTNKFKREERGTPPEEQQPLFYTGHSATTSSPTCLSRRIVHKILRPSAPNGTHSRDSPIKANFEEFQTGTFQPLVNGIKIERKVLPRHTQNEARHRQRKGKYRWGSLSCIHIGSLDESVSEASGSDSFGGYEGVEHLKRSSLGVNSPAIDNNASFNVNTSTNNSFNDLGFPQPTYSRIEFHECDAAVAHVPNFNEFFNYNDKGNFMFVEKPSIPFHSVSCDALINQRSEDSKLDNIVFKGPMLAPSERRTWHEDETFIRQVVDEYFRDTPISDSEDTIVAQSQTPTSIDLEVGKFCECKQHFNDICEENVTNITSYQAHKDHIPVSPKLFSSSKASKTKTFLETIREINKDSFKSVSNHAPATLTEKNSMSIDEEPFWDADETSCYTDDSLGYEADVEPSDRETYGMVFWRQWRSAPNVSCDKIHFNSYTKSKEPQNDVHLNANIKAGTKLNRRSTVAGTLFEYAPRKSSSAGDGKLSNCFIGVEKVRAHKLKHFFDDVFNESKKSTIRKLNKLLDKEKFLYVDKNIYEDCCNDDTLLQQIPGDFTEYSNNNNNISHYNINNTKNFPYVNIKQNQYDKEKDIPHKIRKITSKDDVNSDLTERALSEGLIITRTNAGKEDYSRCSASSQPSESCKNSAVLPPKFHSHRKENLASLRSDEDLTLLAEELPMASKEFLYQSKLVDDSIRSKDTDYYGNSDKTYLDAKNSELTDRLGTNLYQNMFGDSFFHYNYNNPELKWENINNTKSFVNSGINSKIDLKEATRRPTEIPSLFKPSGNKCAGCRPHHSYRMRDKMSYVDSRPPMQPPTSRSMKNLEIKDFGSLGRVQVRGSSNQPKNSKTKQRVVQHVSPVQDVSRSPIEYSPPHEQVSRSASQVRGASQSKFLPNQANCSKVSKVIMGNAQAGEQSNSFSVAERISSTDKLLKKKDSRKSKSHKYFNGFLETFGASGALAKNDGPNTSTTSKDKLKSLLSNKPSVSCDLNERSYIKANKIKCDKYIRKQNNFTPSPSSFVQRTGSQTNGCRNDANSFANSSKKVSEVQNKNADKHLEFLSHSSPISDCDKGEHSIKHNNSSAKSPNSLENHLKNNNHSHDCVAEREEDNSHIYENVLFHKHHYVGKFSYINSLIANCESEGEFSTASGVERDIHTLQSGSSSNLPTNVAPLSDHYEEKKTTSEHKNSDLSFQMQSNKKSEDLEPSFSNTLEVAQVSEPSKPPIMPSFAAEDERDSGEETSESSSGKFSVCPSLSESVASDTSSFYFTAAGGSAIYEALDAVTEYFSAVDKGFKKSNEEGSEFLSEEISSVRTNEIQKELKVISSVRTNEIQKELKEKEISSVRTNEIQKELKENFGSSSSSSEKDDLDDLTCLNSSINEYLSNSDVNNVIDSSSSSCHDYVNTSVVKNNEILVTLNPTDECVKLSVLGEKKDLQQVDQFILNEYSKSGSEYECVKSENSIVNSPPIDVLLNVNNQNELFENEDSKNPISEKNIEDKIIESIKSENLLLKINNANEGYENINSENILPEKFNYDKGFENINSENPWFEKNDENKAYENIFSENPLFENKKFVSENDNLEISNPEMEVLYSKTKEIKTSTIDGYSGVVFASPCWVTSDLVTGSTLPKSLPDYMDTDIKESGKQMEKVMEEERLVSKSHVEILIPKVAELMNPEAAADFANENANTIEENLTGHGSSSIYAPTNFSETSDFHNSTNQTTSIEEDSCTPDEYSNSFSSTEYPSEELSSSLGEFEQPTHTQVPNDPWAFHRMVWEHHQRTHQHLMREHFPDHNHSFVFQSPETVAKEDNNLVLGSPQIVSSGLSPTYLVDAKKPPRSPSHRGRDSNSLPREGRHRFNMRRRCRSFSSCTGGASKEETPSPRPRPTSLFALPKGSTASQESLHDFSLMFSPARGDRAPDARWLAERKKAEGNESYKSKEYRDAIKLYSEAIELCPDCAAYYSNRSACHMMLNKYAQALADAREAVRLDSSFVKGYIRVAKCNVALGDANAALSILRQASELDANNKAVRDEAENAQALIKCVEEVEKATSRKDFRMAIFHLDRALTLAAGCRSLKITKAEYLVYLQRYSDAQEIVNEILQFDNSNVDAIYVRGMCLYYQDNHDAAFTHFQHVLKLAPDHKKAKDVYKKAKLLKQKKEEGNLAFNKGQLKEALNIYSEALAIDPNNHATNSKLYCNRATVRAKLGNSDEAADDCTAAINLNEGYVKAYLRRAKCYQDLEKHDEAVRDYEKVFKLDRNQEHKRLLHDAKLQLKKSKRKDYYKILGVTKTASEDEIKKSYRKMALQHHPDRHANASDKEKQEHEIKFKEIGEAYTVLTDAKKKSLYDRGQDINDLDGGFAHDDVDPNQIFQAFFSQGGSNQFGFGHPGFGGFQNAGFSGGNFPGGFHFQ